MENQSASRLNATESDYVTMVQDNLVLAIEEANIFKINKDSNKNGEIAFAPKIDNPNKSRNKEIDESVPLFQAGLRQIRRISRALNLVTGVTLSNNLINRLRNQHFAFHRYNAEQVEEAERDEISNNSSQSRNEEVDHSIIFRHTSNLLRDPELTAIWPVFVRSFTQFWTNRVAITVYVNIGNTVSCPCKKPIQPRSSDSKIKCPSCHNLCSLRFSKNEK